MRFFRFWMLIVIGFGLLGWALTQGWSDTPAPPTVDMSSAVMTYHKSIN